MLVIRQDESSFEFMQVSRKLTDIEAPRTVMEFNESFIKKACVFQFVNYFSALLYLTFVRGNLFLYNEHSPLQDMRSDCPVPGAFCTDFCIQPDTGRTIPVKSSCPCSLPNGCRMFARICLLQVVFLTSAFFWRQFSSACIYSPEFPNWHGR
jgi:hypothetical protein